MPVKVPEASLARAVAPGTDILPGRFAVNLNVFVPVRNNIGGSGVWFAFLKKKAPIRSPQLSEIKSKFVIVATAPLDLPVIFAPLTRYP